jgi:hypothetical protein
VGFRNRREQAELHVMNRVRILCLMRPDMLARAALLGLSLSVLATAATAATAQDVPKVPLSPVVRVTLQMDSTSSARFDARGFDLRVAQSGPGSAPASIELVKQAGAYTGYLVNASASGSRAPNAVIEVLDSAGTPSVTFRLADVTIVSDHLSLSAARANLEQQRITQQEALSSLTADYQEAQRQLATVEELSKTRVATRLDLARSRDHASDLKQRIDLLKLRQALLARQFAESGPLDETVVLHFARLEIENAQPGGRAMVEGLSRPPSKP